MYSLRCAGSIFCPAQEGAGVDELCPSAALRFFSWSRDAPRGWGQSSEGQRGVEEKEVGARPSDVRSSGPCLFDPDLFGAPDKYLSLLELAKTRCHDKNGDNSHQDGRIVGRIISKDLPQRQ